MSEIALKYGCNPNQSNARVLFDGEMPLKVLNGKPSYINILDCLAAWQVARELRVATGLPGAASFKHVSPAGAGVGKPLSDALREVYMVGDTELTPLATAYARARGGDRLCSFGDAIGVSDVVDVCTAKLIKPEVSDAIIAPGYEPEALEILKQKKKGGYVIFEIDPNYEPAPLEYRDCFGLRLEQDRNDLQVTPELLQNVVTQRNDLNDEARMNLLIATIALKYTQSNSVAIAYDGQIVGIGAGQQSRVHCVRLACSKVDKWILQQHPRVRELQFIGSPGRPEKINIIDQFLLWDELSDSERDELNSKLAEPAKPLTPRQRRDWLDTFKGLALSSDAFFPFRDNIDRASRSGIQFLMQAGGSVRDDLVLEAANQYGMTMILTKTRWFLH
ncbi:TPA: phosphoribosylaminoimidazolecarboxamide formyltransferase [Candidatus Sumerlaeota bacterium]|nr:phosphoribosylaminoimidazolecarboxamide formyltransferase [Candidatus Sumerlaeota bacterium]